MRVKKKKCRDVGCSNYFLPFKSTDKYCSYECSLSAPKKQVKRKYISPVSEGRAEQLAIYRPIRDEYFVDNPICEFEGCECEVQDLHHKNGRLGKMVYNVKYFMSVCRIHHNWMHDHPIEARELGYLI